SFASIKFISADLYKTSDLYNTTTSAYLDANRDTVNFSKQIRENHTKRKQSDNQLTYKQLFKKKDRLWLTTVRFGYVEDQQNGIIKTNTNFYKNGVIDSIDILDQMKVFNGDSRTFGIKSTFSEPFSPKVSLVVDYAYNQNNSNSNRQTLNKDLSGKYSELDPVYSNNFDLNAFSNSGSAILKYMSKKLRFSAGSGISDVRLKLFNRYNNVRNQYDFLNFTPQAQVSYTFKPQSRMSFNYRGTTEQPNINQLQPVSDNSDPLNVFVGNPNLKVGFKHDLSITVSQFKVLSGTGFWLNFGTEMLNNAIANYNLLDTATGKQIYSPVNMNGNSSWYFYGNLFKQAEKKLSRGFELNGNGGRSVNFLNGERNVTNYFSINTGPYLGYDKPDKFNFNFSPRIAYNSTVSSLQANNKTNYFNYGLNMNLYVAISKKYEFNTDMNADFQQRINQFSPGLNIVVWNASFARKVFKDKSGKIIIVANDILDQNKGFNRTINSNFIQEDRYSKISRYFLLKFEWTFNKMPGSK
ncbi:MAG: outer membrane beta-barrel protein, partial [Flavisolibacter sp.]